MYYILYGCMVSNLLIVCKRMHSQRMQMWFRTTVRLDETDLVPRLYRVRYRIQNSPNTPELYKTPSRFESCEVKLDHLLLVENASLFDWSLILLPSCPSIQYTSIHCNFALELLKNPQSKLRPSVGNAMLGAVLNPGPMSFNRPLGIVWQGKQQTQQRCHSNLQDKCYSMCMVLAFRL